MEEEYDNDTASSFSDTFNANNETPITITGISPADNHKNIADNN
ncbi:5881_t:CDS:1, partial [Ambispora gerdemannii]